MPDIFYKCDPSKHSTCKKTYCHINGGECVQTIHIECAKEPIETIKMNIFLSKEDADLLNSLSNSEEE